MRAIVIVVALLLVGCARDPLEPSSAAPVCKALIGPIHYNSRNKTSRRYAGPALVPDLKQRNQVGQQLGCPAYR